MPRNKEEVGGIICQQTKEELYYKRKYFLHLVEKISFAMTFSMSESNKTSTKIVMDEEVRF